MTNKVKVEIRIIDGDWQWMGKLTKESLRVLCDTADNLSDNEHDANCSVCKVERAVAEIKKGKL